MEEKQKDLKGKTINIKIRKIGRRRICLKKQYFIRTCTYRLNKYIQKLE